MVPDHCVWFGTSAARHSPFLTLSSIIIPTNQQTVFNARKWQSIFINIKTLSLKGLNTQELAYIFRSDPQEEKTANRNWDYSVSLTPTACPH